MKPFDDYEIHGCRTYTEATENGVQVFAEQCPDSEAEYWTLFGHIPGQGLETIRDFPTRDAAETMFAQITGIPYGSHDEVQARLRVMHAGPRLLETVQKFWMTEAALDPESRNLSQEQLDGVAALIAEATGRAA